MRHVYKKMLDATYWSIFKCEPINEYADSLSDHCQFCFGTCRHETIDASVTAVSSAHLNRLRCKKERCFETGQKQRIGPLITRKLYLALQLMFR